MVDFAVAGAFTATGALTGTLVRERPVTGAFSGTAVLGFNTASITLERTITSSLGATLGFDIDDTLFVIERSQVWWNTNWLYRRNIWVQSNLEGIETQHPITYYLSRRVVAQNKMRSDLADLEVLRLVSFVPEVWTRVPFVASLGDDVIEVQWENEIETVAGVDIRGAYFVYYGNHSLLGDEETAAYSPPAYPVSLPNTSGLLSYTRPGEYWVTEEDLAVSRVYGAKMTLPFDGDQVRIKATKGPLWGIAEAQVDEGVWVTVDLYASTESFEEVVFEMTNLGVGRHTVRYRHAGVANPTALSTDINFSHVEYRKNAKAIDVGEEANETLLWGSVIGGVVGGT